MKKLNRKVAGLFTIAAALLAFTVVSCANPVNSDPSELQDVISATDKTSVDLSTESFTLKDSSAIVLSKAITLTGGASQYDLKGATLTVKAAGTKIENVTNVAELVIDESVGDGDFTLTNSSVSKLTVKGGGANSIHLEGVAVAAVTVAKEGVRLVLEGATSIAAVDMQAACVLDSTSDIAVIASLTVGSTVKSVTLKGKTKVTTVTAASTEFKMTVASNDVKVESAVVKTSDGKVAAVTVEASGEGVTVPEIKVPEGVTVTEAPKTDEKKAEDQKAEQQKAEDQKSAESAQISVVSTKTTDHLTVNAWSNGLIQIVVSGLPEEETQSNDNHSLKINDGKEACGVSIYIPESKELKKSTYTVYWPFTEKDKSYKINLVYSYKDTDDKEVKYDEAVEITASDTYLAFSDYVNADNYKKIKLSAEYNSTSEKFDILFDAGNLLYTDLFTKDKITSKSGSFGSFGFCAGKTWWADSSWDGGNNIYYDGNSDSVFALGLDDTTVKLFTGNEVSKVPALWGSATGTELINKIKSKNNNYCAYCDFKFSISEFPDTIFALGTIWTDQLTYKDPLPATVGTDPFSGKTFTGSTADGSNVVFKFLDDNTMQYSSGSTVTAESSYTVNADKKRLYIQVTKMDFGSGLITREECYNQYAANSNGLTTDVINSYVNAYFGRYEYTYEIADSTVTLTGTVTEEPKNYFATYACMPGSEYFKYTDPNDSEKVLKLEGWYFEPKFGSYQREYNGWCAISVTDTSITYMANGNTSSGSLPSSITIPYTYPANDADKDTVTITYDGNNYTLDAVYNSITGTLADNE